MPTYSKGSFNTPDIFGGIYGVQGGDWGTGQDTGKWAAKAIERLLSPVEFGRLDSRVQSVYGGYMGYINAFTRQQKIKKAIPAAYLSAKAGTYEPPQGGVSYGKPVSTRGRAATGAGGVAIPKTTIHRDIYGRPTQELAGGGVRRDIGGEVIPQTAEQVGEVADIARSAAMAIPRAKEKTAEELIGRIGTKKKLEDELLLAGMKPIERYKQSIRGQAQQKIELSAQKIKQKGDLALQSQTFKEYNTRLTNELKRGRMELADTLKGASDEINREWKKSMVVLKGRVPDTPQSRARIAEELSKAEAINKMRLTTAKTMSEINFAEAQELALNNYRARLEQMSLAPGIWTEKERVAAEQKRVGAYPVGQQQSTSVKEVKRSINGRIAIFNADTKAFIRWE